MSEDAVPPKRSPALCLLAAAAASDPAALLAALDMGVHVDAILSASARDKLLTHHARKAFSKGATALWISCFFALDPYAAAGARAGAMRCVNILLERGAAPNALKGGGASPMTAATAQLGYVREEDRAKGWKESEAEELFRALAQAGARVDDVGTTGRAPLGECVLAQMPELSRALVELGADIHRRDASGRTLVEHCCVNGLARALPVALSVGGDASARSPEGVSALAAALSSRGRSAPGRLSCVRTLINHGCEIGQAERLAVERSPWSATLMGDLARREARELSELASEPSPRLGSAAPRL